MEIRRHGTVRTGTYMSRYTEPGRRIQIRGCINKLYGKSVQVNLRSCKLGTAGTTAAAEHAALARSAAPSHARPALGSSHVPSTWLNTNARSNSALLATLRHWITFGWQFQGSGFKVEGVCVCVRSRDVDAEGTDLRSLNTFHHQCVRIIVGVSRRDQWDNRVTSVTMARTLCIDCDVADIIREYRLRWLGHVGWMNDARMPKRVLLGSSLQHALATVA